MNLFRAVKPQVGVDPAQKLYRPHSSPRIPRNVPQLVDNLWEWTRPEHLPSRRYAAFASPTPELAVAAAGKGSLAFAVRLGAGARVCQLAGFPDAKFHPDCESLPRRLLELLGTEPGIESLAERNIARLETECLHKNEVDAIFATNTRLRQLGAQLRKSVTYWSSVTLLGEPEDIRDPAGEIYFEYPSGYRLAAINR